MTRPEIDHTMCKIDQCYLCQDHQHHYCLKDISAWSTMLWLRWKSCVSSLLIGGGLIRLNCHKKCRLVSEADRIWQEATNLATFTFWQPEAQRLHASYYFWPKRERPSILKCALLCLWTTVKRKVSRAKIKSVGRLSKFPDHGNLDWKCSGVCSCRCWVEHLIWTFNHLWWYINLWQTRF